MPGAETFSETQADYRYFAPTEALAKEQAMQTLSNDIGEAVSGFAEALNCDNARLTRRL